ncbi:DoxX family membrane protein [Haloterrigena turkmenica]|uniref:DoxX family membrane protein n=1 Tax=Haloterrigena turkmenica TaxID=62320 RepID=UPI00299ECEBC|nr:DoxX family membrane protein [Haloterrigena turkmenica]
MKKFGLPSLRCSVGMVFIWFGGLKVLGISPAAELVANTVYWLPPSFFVPFLGIWEVTIGIFLLFNKFIRVAIFLLFLQMPGTMLPVILLPDTVFTQFPLGLSLEGQYIAKNLVLISAALVIGSTVRSQE